MVIVKRVTKSGEWDAGVAVIAKSEVDAVAKCSGYRAVDKMALPHNYHAGEYLYHAINE
jgi:hypothetical protein